MHFSGSWWIALIAIGIYTLAKGGGWKEFIDNDTRFSNWLADNCLRFFLAILVVALIFFAAFIFLKH